MFLFKVMELMGLSSEQILAVSGETIRFMGFPYVDDPQLDRGLLCIHHIQIKNNLPTLKPRKLCSQMNDFITPTHIDVEMY